jgi:hypothetical protein
MCNTCFSLDVAGDSATKAIHLEKAMAERAFHNKIIAESRLTGSKTLHITIDYAQSVLLPWLKHSQPKATFFSEKKKADLFGWSFCLLVIVTVAFVCCYYFWRLTSTKLSLLQGSRTTQRANRQTSSCLRFV